MQGYRTATDDTLHESVRHGTSGYPFAYYREDIWQFDFHRIDWHWHHELEFLLSSESAVSCLVGTDRIELPKGYGIFINSGLLHRYEAKESAYSPNIVFSPALLAPEGSLIYEKYIAPVIRSSVPYRIFAPDVPWQNRILQLLRRIFALQEALPHSELPTVRYLMQLWEILSEHLETAAHSPELSRPDHRQAKLQLMIQYIHDHYAEELTLDRIAAAASLSKSGALNLFHSGIATSPVAYLIQYRLSQAAALLSTTQKAVSAIAAETGFASSGYFCRKFRQHYHMSATEYRRQKHLERR